MEDPSTMEIKHMTMEDLVRNADYSGISEIAENSTKGIRFRELRSEVPMIS